MDIVEEKNKLGPILRLVEGGKKGKARRSATIEKAKRDLGIPDKVTQMTKLPGLDVTLKQENFAKAIALKAMSYSDAYRASYNADKMADSTIYEHASRLMAQDKIKARVEYWRNKNEQVTTHSPEYIRDFIERRLLEMADDPKARPSDHAKAIELLGKLTKVAAFSERIETIEQLPDNSDDIKERIEQVLAKSA